MKASITYLRITPRKLRLVADLIKGKEVEKATNILKFCPKRGARYILKLVNSAFANASLNREIDTDSLYVSRVIVNPGVILKRFRTAPRGRGVPIKKRTSHVTVLLAEKAHKKANKETKKTKIKETKSKEPQLAPASEKPVEGVSNIVKQGKEEKQ
jgi:large subunit ribosomal protein L22